MHVRDLRFAIGLVAVSGLLAACSLTSLFYPPVDYSNPDFSFDPNFSFEPFRRTSRRPSGTGRRPSRSPRASHGSWSCHTLRGDSPSIVLPGFGAIVAWRGGDWELKIEGGPSGGLGSGGLGSGSPVLTIIREDTDPSLQADGTTCTITYSSTTPAHIAGRAICKGLAWVDVLANPMDLPVPSGSPTVDHPLFDATIVFDATPSRPGGSPAQGVPGPSVASRALSSPRSTGPPARRSVRRS